MSSYNEASSHKTVQIINIVLYSYADIAYVHVTVGRPGQDGTLFLI